MRNRVNKDAIVPKKSIRLKSVSIPKFELSTPISFIGNEENLKFSTKKIKNPKLIFYFIIYYTVYSCF